MLAEVYPGELLLDSGQVLVLEQPVLLKVVRLQKSTALVGMMLLYWMALLYWMTLIRFPV